MPNDQAAATADILRMLGTDPRILALVNALTPRDFTDPMAANKAVGGEPGFYQGSKLGAYIYPPGPIQQSHPVLGAMAGMLANRRNAAERERLRRAAAGLGGQPPLSRPSPATTFGGVDRGGAAFGRAQDEGVVALQDYLRKMGG